MARKLKPRTVIVTYNGGEKAKANACIFYTQLALLFKPTVSKVVLAYGVTETKTDWIVQATHVSHMGPDDTPSEGDFSISKKNANVACICFGDEDDFHNKLKLFVETYKTWLATGFKYENLFVTHSVNGVYWWYEYILARWLTFFKMLMVFPKVTRWPHEQLYIHNSIMDLSYNLKLSKYKAEVIKPKAYIERLLKEVVFPKTTWSSKTYKQITDTVWHKKEEELLLHIWINIWQDVTYNDSFALPVRGGSRIVDVTILPMALGTSRDEEFAATVVATAFNVLHKQAPIAAIALTKEEGDSSTYKITLGFSKELESEFDNKDKELIGKHVVQSIHEQVGLAD